MTGIAAVAVLVVVAGCSSTVSGSAQPEPAGGPAVTTTTGAPVTTTTSRGSRTTAATSTTSAPPVVAPPTAIDPDANQQYCETTITGALGKRMHVVVVETPNGRITCDQAGAVLVDYYAVRPNPEPGSPPIEVAGFACNQVPEPDLPQVICTDGASLIYSMWPQGGG